MAVVQRNPSDPNHVPLDSGSSREVSGSWTQCPACGLKHRARADGSCPRCKAGKASDLPPAQDASTNPFSAPREDELRGPGVPIQSTQRAELAEPLIRLVANIIDGLAVGGIIAIGGIVAAIAIPNLIKEGNPQLTTIIPIIGFFVIAVLGICVVQIYFLSRDGQTLGKKAVRIRIVDPHSHEPPGFVRAFLLRGFVNQLLGSIPFVGVFYTLTDILFIFSEDHRCLHDRLADTIVVKVD